MQADEIARVIRYRVPNYAINGREDSAYVGGVYEAASAILALLDQERAKAVEAEREACARAVESHPSLPAKWSWHAQREIADAIRARTTEPAPQNTGGEHG